LLEREALVERVEREPSAERLERELQPSGENK